MLFENYVKNCGCEYINSDNSPSKIVVKIIYITYFKCKDTCISSVNKKHKKQYNRNQHQRPYNASSNCPCLCKKENK